MKIDTSAQESGQSTTTSARDDEFTFICSSFPDAVADLISSIDAGQPGPQLVEPGVDYNEDKIEQVSKDIVHKSLWEAGKTLHTLIGNAEELRNSLLAMERVAGESELVQDLLVKTTSFKDSAREPVRGPSQDIPKAIMERARRLRELTYLMKGCQEIKFAGMVLNTAPKHGSDTTNADSKHS